MEDLVPQGPRRVERPAVRHRVDLVERLERTDRGDRRHKEGGRTEERKGDLREDLPLARAVQARRLVVLRRDVAEAGQEDHDLEADEVPDREERDDDESEARAGQPAGQREPDR